MNNIENCILELKRWVKTRIFYEEDYPYFSLSNYNDKDILYIYLTDFRYSKNVNLSSFVDSELIISWVLEHITPILLKHNVKEFICTARVYILDRNTGEYKFSKMLER